MAGLVKNIRSLVPNLLELAQDQSNYTIDFDQEADVLYISYGKPSEATDSEMVSEDIVLRKRDNAVIGITVMHASAYR